MLQLFGVIVNIVSKYKVAPLLMNTFIKNDFKKFNIACNIGETGFTEHLVNDAVIKFYYTIYGCWTIITPL